MTPSSRTHPLSSSHLIHLIALCLVALTSYISGNILPNPIRSDRLEQTFVLQARTKKPSKIFVLSQVAHEEISKKQAPSSSYLKEQVNDAWGVAKQVDEHTWSMKVNDDHASGSSRDILQALNAYRRQHGVSELSWDNSLGDFAQGRADGFVANGGMDGHAGFNDLINNQDGFHKLGFMALGENSSYGYHLEAVHLIEWVYAGDAPHNNNQLDPQWTHVGIGVSGDATDLVFGGRKM